MKRIVTLFFAFLVLALFDTSYAQTAIYRFQKLIGGAQTDIVNAIDTAANGDFLLVGYTESYGGSFAGDRDVYVVRTSPSGMVKWAKTYGTSNKEEGFSIAAAPNGGFFVAGNSIDSATLASSVNLLYIDSLGSLVWNKTYDIYTNAWASVIRKVGDHHWVIGGKAYANLNDDYEAFLMEVDETGAVQWTRGYNSDLFYVDAAKSVVPTADGGFFITGDAYLIQIHDYNVFAVKTDSMGNAEWSRSYASSFSTRGIGGCQTPDHGYIIAGTKGDLLLMRTDSLGNLIWSKTYGGPNPDLGHSLLRTDTGYAFIAETNSFSADGTLDGYIVEVDTGGGLVRSMVFGDTMQYEGLTCAVNTPTGLAIAGPAIPALDGFGIEDFYFVKMDNDTSGCLQADVSTTVTSASFTSNSFSQQDNPAPVVNARTPLVQSGYLDTTICFSLRIIPGDTTQTTVKGATGLLRAKVYPNPSEGGFTVVLPQEFSTSYSMNVYSNMGVEVSNRLNVQRNGRTVKMAADQLADGDYILIIRDGRGKQIVERMTLAK